MKLNRETGGMVASLLVHLAILGPLAFWTMVTQSDDLKIAIETMFAEERPPEEFTREMSLDQQVSETLNVMEAGGAVTQAVGGSNSAVAAAQTKIENNEQIKDPQVQVNVGAIDTPGMDVLGDDLGEGEVTGEVGAVVEGYGAAMSRIAQELVRMMREQRVMCVWLFDESESMEDDRQFIKEEFRKIYDELGIASKKDNNLKNSKDKELLLTAIMSFGKATTAVLEKPTDDDKLIKSAIDKIKNDPTGAENTLAAINAAVAKYRAQANAQKRKLVVIVVTDESGDDDSENSDVLSETITNLKRTKTPIYILGRESIFGYPIARVAYKDPDLGLTHWLPIKRGPETADPECLQFDGFHERWDSFPSGFGPYTQARMCKETGGIFFILPSEEQNIVGQAAADKRKFAFLDLKEYNPDLNGRREYRQERDKSKFRAAIWNVIKTLNPHTDGQLHVRTTHFESELAEFNKQGAESFGRAVRALSMLNAALADLEKVRPLRASEESQRWRAHYDLIVAQCMAYRVRLFQYLLALDQMKKNKTMPKDPKHNQWSISYVANQLEPDPEQVKLTKIDLKELQDQEKKAKDQYEFVIKTHPRTPWANRAEWERNQGFGIQFNSFFWDPRYKTYKFKLPTL
jgi:hypothetical protein